MGALVKVDYPARTEGNFNQAVEITAGKTLKVETSPAGVEIFSDTVPAGKKWSARIYISVTETDA